MLDSPSLKKTVKGNSYITKWAFWGTNMWEKLT